METKVPENIINYLKIREDAKKDVIYEAWGGMLPRDGKD